MSQYGVCSVCLRAFVVFVPEGGDGSEVVLRLHGQRFKRCAGSRRAPVRLLKPKHARPRP